MRPALLSLVTFSFLDTAQAVLPHRFQRHQLKAFHLHISSSRFCKKMFQSRLGTVKQNVMAPIALNKAFVWKGQPTASAGKHLLMWDYKVKIPLKPPRRAMSSPAHFGSSFRDLEQLLWITPAKGVCLWKNFSQTQLVGLCLEWYMTEGVNKTSNRPLGQNWKA